MLISLIDNYPQPFKFEGLGYKIKSKFPIDTIYTYKNKINWKKLEI